jgi:hypothetical protein
MSIVWYVPGAVEANSKTAFESASDGTVNVTAKT